MIKEHMSKIGYFILREQQPPESIRNIPIQPLLIIIARCSLPFPSEPNTIVTQILQEQSFKALWKAFIWLLLRKSPFVSQKKK